MFCNTHTGKQANTYWRVYFKSQSLLLLFIMLQAQGQFRTDFTARIAINSKIREHLNGARVTLRVLIFFEMLVTYVKL